MHVQYVALCDQVIIGNDGRPSVIGIFSDIQAPSLPVTLPRLCFVARLLFTSDELGANKHIELLITDPEGKEIGRPGGDLSLPAAPPGHESLAVDVPLQFDFFEMPLAGRYTFLLHVDGSAAAAAQLAVRHAALA